MGLEEARTAVLAGAAWLDTQPAGIPAGWRAKINIRTLDIAHCAACIGGQLFPDGNGTMLLGFGTMLEIIRVADGVEGTRLSAAVRYGFCPPGSTPACEDYAAPGDYAGALEAYAAAWEHDAGILTQAWQEYLS